MDLFKSFALDPARLEKGVWHVFTEKTDEIVPEAEIGDRPAVLIASTDNPLYRQNLQKKLTQIATKRRGAELDAAQDARMTAEMVADHIILDWRNWTIQDTPAPYSRDLVIKIWTDPAWVLLKYRLAGMAGEVDAFKAFQDEAILKN